MMDYNNGIHTPYNPQQQAITTDALPDRPKLRQVAEWLGVNYSTARRMALEGAIPCKKIQRRKQIAYLFDKAALLEWARPEGAA